MKNECIFDSYPLCYGSPRLTDIAYILIANYIHSPEDVSSIKSFISQLTVIKPKMLVAVKSAENTTNQTTVCSLYVTNWSPVSFNNQVQPAKQKSNRDRSHNECLTSRIKFLSWQLNVLLTLFSKFFSPFLRSTCMLLVSLLYSSLRN